MFERFTEPARQVVVLAQEEARAFKHNYIGTEHILLGLLREWDGLGARVLDSLGITIQEVRAGVGGVVGYGDEVTSGQIPFTPRGKKILELALREAEALGHNYIGTEHLLLGIARENEGVASSVLLNLGADAQTIRSATLDLLEGYDVRQHISPSRLGAGQRVTISVSKTDGRGNGVALWLARNALVILLPAALGVGILIGWLIWG